MFEKVVIADTGADRKWYFFFSTSVLTIALAVGLLVSLFSIRLSLGTEGFELVRLVTPVQPPDVEPPPPPAQASQPDVIKKPQAVVKVPTRQVNMARVDESPPDVPKKVSTTPNTQKARPESRYFEIGKLDRDPVGGFTSERATGTGTASGEGTGLAATSKPKVTEVEPPPPPPPPKKKAPEPVARKPVTRSLGVINGKATSLPKPRYPAAARAINAEGKVDVHVLIDESGHVVSANAVSGHPLLRNAAEAAARQARFTPTQLSGVPVKVSGTIVYNFKS